MTHERDGVNPSSRSGRQRGPAGLKEPAEGISSAGRNKGAGKGTADVQSVARAADVLRAVAAAPEGIHLAQLASGVHLSRSTVHRIVLALIRQDFIRAADAGYRLGPGLLRLAEASRASFETDMHEHLLELSQDLEETVDLSVLTGQTTTFVDQIVPSRRLRAVSGIGVSFPLHCTANGKAVLAALPRGALDQLLPARLERFTPATHVTRATLERELEEIREHGVAFDREEHTIGICALGVALRSLDGSWYAVSVPLPSQRFYGHEERLKAALQRAYGRMSGSIAGDGRGAARRTDRDSSVG